MVRLQLFRTRFEIHPLRLKNQALATELKPHGQGKINNKEKQKT